MMDLTFSFCTRLYYVVGSCFAIFMFVQNDQVSIVTIKKDSLIISIILLYLLIIILFILVY
jgi:hypothetical protein